MTVNERYRRMQLEWLMGETARNGRPGARRLQQILRMPEGSFEKSELEFLEKFIGSDVDERTELLVLQVLCRFGGLVRDYAGRLSHMTSRMRGEVIRIAEGQGDAETIVDMASEEGRNVNDAVLALKRIGRTECLASYLFSSNESLVSLVRSVAQ